MREIIIKFPDDETLEKFIGQMMDGFGENYCDFSHWHEQDGGYVKKYDADGRLICTVDNIFLP